MSELRRSLGRCRIFFDDGLLDCEGVVTVGKVKQDCETGCAFDWGADRGFISGAAD